MNAVDTNVLLYIHDPRDAYKQAVAASEDFDAYNHIERLEIVNPFRST